LSRDSLSPIPSADARPAPICKEGSSGPKDWPEPMARAAVMTLPHGGSKWNVTVVDLKGCLGLVDTAAAHSRENVKNQNRNQESD
jgi:hypothetical protein